MFQQAQSLFAKLSPSKRKKSKTNRSLDDEFDAEMAETADGADSDAPHTSFNEADKSFLMEMVKTLASHTEQSQIPLKQSIEELKKENQSLREEVNSLKAGVTTPDVEKIAEIVMSRVSVQAPPGLATPSRDDSSQSGASASQQSQDDRGQLFIMGNLGNHDERPLLVSRAKEVMQAAGITSAQIQDLFAPQGLSAFSDWKMG